MIRLFYYCILVFFLFQSAFSYADALSSLTLTPAEMQKLKKYFPTESSDHLIWEGNALEIRLPIGKEKRIIFPSAITVDAKGSLSTEQLSLINNNKSLYLTPHKQFARNRIYVTLKDSGTVVLIDLVTDSSVENFTQYIEIKEKANIKSEAIIRYGNIENNTNAKPSSYVGLIRFAWRQAYGPDNLSKNSFKFARSPMKTQKFIPGLVYGDKVMAFPQASWVSGNHYVTAVLIRNKYQHTTRIDISKELCGHWLAGAIYPRSLLSAYKNVQKDSAILFLVSDRPFGEVIRICYGDA